MGLEIHRAVVGRGGFGVRLGHLDCPRAGASWRGEEDFALGLCGATGGLGLFQIREFFRGKFAGGFDGGGVGTGVDDAEYSAAGGGEFLHFSGDQLSGVGLQWVGGGGAEFFADGGVSGIFSASGGGADHSGAFVFAAAQK